MSAALAPGLQKGVPMRDLLKRLGAVQVEGRAIGVVLGDRAVPYVGDVVVDWVDGPPSSVVAYVLSGADPGGQKWRRWTISKVGPWRYELDCFPTPFHNARDPLAPGVPPSSSRRG